MKQSDYSLTISNLQKMMKKHKEKGHELFFDAIFITDNKSKKIVNKGTHDELSFIPDHLECSKPDSIRFEFFDSKEATLCRFPRLFPLKEPTTIQQIPIQPEFRGFGEAEINTIVDQRFRERQQKEEFEQLRVQVGELTKELEEQTNWVDELETENEQLKTELESKKQVRYYAGMLGDILEGIGISKEKIRNPIASLMGVTENEKPTEVSQSTQQHNDSSGIVEDEEPISPEQKKRDEVISLMNDYLNATDNQTLANLFTIFSEIESNQTKAIDIMTFIHSNK